MSRDAVCCLVYINLPQDPFGGSPFCLPLLLCVELEFGNVGFCGGRKTGVPGEKLTKQKQQQTQPTYGAEELNPGHAGGRRVL